MPKNNLRRNRQLRINDFIAAQRAGVTDAEKGAAVKLAEYTDNRDVKAGLAGYGLLLQIHSFADKICGLRPNELAQGIKPEDYAGVEVLDQQDNHYQQVKKARDELQQLQEKREQLNAKKTELAVRADLIYPLRPGVEPTPAQKTARVEIDKIDKQLEDGVDENGEVVLGLISQIAQKQKAVEEVAGWTADYLAKQEALNNECQKLKDALKIDSLKAMYSYLPLMAAQIDLAEELDPEFTINDDKGVTKSKETLDTEYEALFQQYLHKYNLKYAPKDGDKKDAELVLMQDKKDGPAPTAKQIVDMAILKGWQPEVRLIPGEEEATALTKIGRGLCLVTEPNPVQDVTAEFNRRGIGAKVLNEEKLSPYQKTVNDTINTLAKNGVPAIPKGQPVPFAEIYKVLVEHDTAAKAKLPWYQREKTHAQYASQYVNELNRTALGRILDDLDSADVPTFLKQLDKNKEFNPKEATKIYTDLVALVPAQPEAVTRYLNGLSPKTLKRILAELPEHKVSGFLKRWHNKSSIDQVKIYENLDLEVVAKQAANIPSDWWKGIAAAHPAKQPAPAITTARTALDEARTALTAANAELAALLQPAPPAAAQNQNPVAGNNAQGAAPAVGDQAAIAAAQAKVAAANAKVTAANEALQNTQNTIANLQQLKTYAEPYAKDFQDGNKTPQQIQELRDRASNLVHKLNVVMGMTAEQQKKVSYSVEETGIMRQVFDWAREPQQGARFPGAVPAVGSSLDTFISGARTEAVPREDKQQAARNAERQAREAEAARQAANPAQPQGAQGQGNPAAQNGQIAQPNANPAAAGQQNSQNQPAAAPRWYATNARQQMAKAEQNLKAAQEEKRASAPRFGSRGGSGG
jgi:hypothetical protein